MADIEKPDEEIDSLEQKQKKIEGFDKFSDSEQRAFNDLSSNLGKPKNG